MVDPNPVPTLKHRFLWITDGVSGRDHDLAAGHGRFKGTKYLKELVRSGQVLTTDAGIVGDTDTAVLVEGDGRDLTGAPRTVLVVTVIAWHRIGIVAIDVVRRVRILCSVGKEKRKNEKAYQQQHHLRRRHRRRWSKREKINWSRRRTNQRDKRGSTLAGAKFAPKQCLKTMRTQSVTRIRDAAGGVCRKRSSLLLSGKEEDAIIGCLSSRLRVKVGLERPGR